MSILNPDTQDVPKNGDILGEFLKALAEGSDAPDAISDEEVETFSGFLSDLDDEVDDLGGELFLIAGVDAAYVEVHLPGRPVLVFAIQGEGRAERARKLARVLSDATLEAALDETSEEAGD